MSKLDKFLEHAFGSTDAVKKQQLKNLFTNLMLETWQEVGNDAELHVFSATLRKKVEKL
jgi:hypothetical protein